jgi:hypothetical protein
MKHPQGGLLVDTAKDPQQLVMAPVLLLLWLLLWITGH